MNRTSRTLSALLRSDWCIDEQYARDHESVVNHLLAGTFTRSMFFGDDDEDEQPLAYTVSFSASGSTSLTRRELDDPDMPENSILVVPIAGPIFKEGFCGSAGALDYAQAINQAYANPKIIGTIQLVDSPGGQLSGTPTLYDAIRNPAKPSISIIHDGMMASAALWLSAGSTKIYASQPTDQVGSIGVFVTLRDSTAAMEKAGYKTIHVYSDLSPEKNKPVREAIAGNTKPLREDLNRAAGHFHSAVKTGRGDRLKPVAKDGPNVFEGGMFYADDAIELGLIDGYSTLEAAVAEINQLHTNRTEGGTQGSFATSQAPQPQAESLDQDAHIDVPPAAPEAAHNPEPATADPADTATPQSNQNSTTMGLFGNKFKALAGIAGKEAADITDDQLNALNAELDSEKITTVRIISTAYLQQADESVAALNAANAQIATLTKERDEARAEAAKFGSQPGAEPTKTEKVNEKISDDQDVYISQTDADLAKMKAALK